MKVIPCPLCGYDATVTGVPRPEEGVVAAPGNPIGELPLLTEAESHQLLVEWNDTATDYPDKCVHQLFEEELVFQIAGTELVAMSVLLHGAGLKQAPAIAQCMHSGRIRRHV